MSDDTCVRFDEGEDGYLLSVGDRDDLYPPEAPDIRDICDVCNGQECDQHPGSDLCLEAHKLMREPVEAPDADVGALVERVKCAMFPQEDFCWRLDHDDTDEAGCGECLPKTLAMLRTTLASLASRGVEAERENERLRKAFVAEVTGACLSFEGGYPGWKRDGVDTYACRLNSKPSVPIDEMRERCRKCAEEQLEERLSALTSDTEEVEGQ